MIEFPITYLKFMLKPYTECAVIPLVKYAISPLTIQVTRIVVYFNNIRIFIIFTGRE